MIGKVLALTGRSLRSDARGLGLPLCCGVLAASILFAIQQFGGQGYRAAPGLDVFEMIVYLNFWAITLAGVSYFATAITEEKDQRTLGLLSLAGIPPLGVLAGKWLPRMLAAIAVLCVQLPFTFLCVTLGGLSWQQVLAAFAALLAYLMFAGCLGLLASVVMRSSNAAAGATAIILLISEGYPFGISLVVQAAWYFTGSSPVRGLLVSLEPAITWLREGNTFVRLTNILNSGGTTDLWHPQIGGCLVTAAGCAGLSWLLFTPCTQNEGEATVSRRHPSVWNKRPGRRPSRRAWQSALAGKDFRSLCGGPWGIAALLMAETLFVCLIAIVNGFFVNGMSLASSQAKEVGQAAVLVGLVMLLVSLGIISSFIFRMETAGRTWDTLCLLPRSIRSIAYSKLAGGSLILLPSVIFILGGLLLAPSILADMEREFRPWRAEFALLCLNVILIALAAHVSAWTSIAARWGYCPVALAVGVTIPIVCDVMITSLLRPNSGTAVFLYLCCPFFAVITVLLHRRIGWKLEELAGE